MILEYIGEKNNGAAVQAANAAEERKAARMTERTAARAAEMCGCEVPWAAECAADEQAAAKQAVTKRAAKQKAEEQATAQVAQRVTAKNVPARIAANTAEKHKTAKQVPARKTAKAAKKAAAVRSLPELRRCDLCGKIFKKRTKNQRFCNRGCYAKFMQEYGNAQTSETLCWDCANTNGNACPWFSEKMQPVEGWTAELRETTDGVSYFVIDCPNFCLDKRLVKKGKMTKSKCGLPQAVACDVCGQEN